MKSWREKLSTVAERVKETASGKLASVRETAEKTYNKVATIANEVRTEVANVVGEVLEPKQTADAVTPDGQVYTVAVDAGNRYPQTFGGSRVSVPQVSAEERERRELEALIPKNGLFSATAHEVKDVFASIRSSIKGATSLTESYIASTKARVSSDISDVADRASRLIRRNKEEKIVVPVSAGRVDQHAPTIMNMSKDTPAPVTPKKKIPTPKPLAVSLADKGKNQKDISGGNGGNPEGPKDPKGPRSNRNLKLAVAGLAAALAGTAVWTFDDNPTQVIQSNIPAPTTSTKAPEKKVETVPTVTVEPKTVEMPAPPEQKKVIHYESHKKNAKRSELHRKDPVIDYTEPKKEPAKTTTTTVAIPMKPGHAAGVSTDLKEILAELQFAAGSNDLGKKTALYRSTDFFSGTSTRIEMDNLDGVTRGSILNYIATAENLRKKYDSNQDCLNPDAKKEKSDCDPANIWTMDNAETLTAAAAAANKAAEMAKLNKQRNLIGTQQDILVGLEQTIAQTIANIKDADKQHELRRQYFNLQARIAVAKKRSANTSSSSSDKIRANESYSNRLRLMIARAESLRVEASKSVVNSHGYKKKDTQSTRVRVATVKPAPERVVTQAPQIETDEDLRDWIPESI